MSEANKQQPSEELIEADYQAPPDHSHLDRAVRLELLVGHLADLLTPALELILQLRLLTNAGHTTRSELALLNEFTGDIWTRLGIIRDEIEALKCRDVPPDTGTSTASKEKINDDEQTSRQSR